MELRLGTFFADMNEKIQSNLDAAVEPVGDDELEYDDELENFRLDDYDEELDIACSNAEAMAWEAAGPPALLGLSEFERFALYEASWGAIGSDALADF